MKATDVMKMGLLLVLVALSPAFAWGQDDEVVENIIKEAEHCLYTARQRSLYVLEQAVLERPERPELWEELIYVLDVDSKDFFAERASRTALKYHPGNPQLLMARARILEPSPALGVLGQLSEVAGYKEEARLRREMVELGIPGPRTPVKATSPSPEWIDRLVAAGRYERALAVTEHGLQFSPGDKHLLGRKAIVLCLLDRYQDAMAANKLAGGVHLWENSQGSYSGIPYRGMTDCLVLKKQWKLAVESLAGTQPKDSYRRLGLGLALLRTGKPKEAERLLAQAGMLGRLLLYGHASESGEEERTASMEAGLLQAIEEESERCFRAPYPVSQVFFPAHPVSIVLRSGLSALVARHPEARVRVVRCFGSLEAPGPQRRATERVFRTPDRTRQLRNELAEELTTVQDYAGAAAALAPIAARRTSRWNRQHARINMDSVNWCILRRRADAEALYQKSPHTLASVRFLLANISATQWNYANIPGKPWLSHSEVVKQLCEIGPGVLSSVFDEYGPNTISGLDRSPYVRVIEGTGSVQDVPVLLSVLAIVVREDTEEGPKRNTAARKATEKAIHHCLEKLTEIKNTAHSRTNRVLFWLDWWEDNARQLVSVAEPVCVHPENAQQDAAHGRGSAGTAPRQ
jgi:hypothetical protein